jgi:hypothetical protein
LSVHCNAEQIEEKLLLPASNLFKRKIYILKQEIDPEEKKLILNDLINCDNVNG